MAFFAACSTPTVSNDDSDESSELAEQGDNSSSSVIESSGSSARKVKCPASLNVEWEWSWDVPKECFFNPDIEYGSMTDSRDGQVYRTVKIGNQVWMAENLNFDPGQGGSGDAKYDWSWCYEDDPKKCAVAGRLYTWAAAIDSVTLATNTDNPQDCGYGKTCSLPDIVHGICPSGWHLPTVDEMLTLVDDVGGLDNVDEILKSQMGWYDGGNGTDGVGFSVLPVGGRDGEGSQYVGDGKSATFWTATEVYSYGANSVSLFYDIYIMYFFDKDLGYSVRCLKD